jgi:MFS family permease
MSIMFAVGYYIPTTELHFLSYGIKEENMGYWFITNTFAYALSSYFVSLIPESVHKARLMLFGICILAISFVLMGPSPLFFSPSLTLTVVGLFGMGVGGGFMYVPSVPHMIKVAHDDYGYSEDHRLNDTISSIATISLCAGEIFGPVTASVLYSLYGYAYAATIIAGVFAAYAGVYALKSDAVWQRKKNIGRIDNAMMELLERGGN